MSKSYIYFAQAGEDGPIKIGFTLGDPRRRLVKLQSDCPATVQLLGAVEGELALEAEFHARLAVYRLKGEWFHPHADVLAAIDAAVSSDTGWTIPIKQPRRAKYAHPICEYRAKAGITLRELADRIGISHASLSRYESGSHLPNIDTLERLVEVTAIPAHLLRPDLAALFAQGTAE